ncbi:MAG: hypothetical protein PHV59_03290 [Victivallales bacterium]|nr:hypothetical protein [Victivallales bacterium]
MFTRQLILTVIFALNVIASTLFAESFAIARMPADCTIWTKYKECELNAIRNSDNSYTFKTVKGIPEAKKAINWYSPAVIHQDGLGSGGYELKFAVRSKSERFLLLADKL